MKGDKQGTISLTRREALHLGFGTLLNTAVTVLALLAVGTGQVLAADFYVGGAGASDNNPGSASRPFATIQKAAAVATAGDTVKIRTGTYRETVVPANSGAPGRLITFQPDGDAQVTISGADLVDGDWAVYSDRIYQKTITLPVTGYGEQITGNETLLTNQVFVGGKMMIEARWPNLADSDDLLNRADFRPIAKDAWTTGPGGTAILRDAGIPEIAGGWAGGTIWYIGWYAPSTSTITASSAGQIEFSSKAPEKFRDSYYLTGKLGALDAEKEWFYDGSKLYLWAPGGGPPAHVEVKRRNYAFDLSGKSNITIRNLHVFAATITTDATSADITLDGLKARYISHFVTLPAKDVIYSHSDDSGIRLMGPNNVIRNSIIEYSAGHGIVLGGDGCVADNNLIHDISYGGTYCCGILPAPGGARNTITRNTIFRTGRSAIDMVYSNKEIAYNDIHGFGLINTDLGAIYAARKADLIGTRIHHNWIHDAGNDKGHAFPVGCGIYFEHGARSSLIDHNAFWNNHMNDMRLEQINPPYHRVFNNTLASTGAKFWESYLSYGGDRPETHNNNIYRAPIKPDKPGTHEMTAATDPKFTNAGAGGLKFRLRPDSPAIDRGAVIPGVTDGHTGTAPDLGAYEYGGEAWRAGSTVQPPMNLVHNPGFEDPQLTPWNNAPRRDGVSSDSPRSGRKCYKIEVKPSGGSTHGLFYCWQSIKGNWQGKRFKFSGWMRLVDTTGDSTIAIKFYKTLRGAGGYEKVHCISWRKGTMDWTHFEGIFTAQDTTQEILIYMLCQPGTGVAYCDDFHLELLDDIPPMGWNTSGSYNLAGENEEMVKRGVDAIQKGIYFHSAASASNLSLNPSFEDGRRDWNFLEPGQVVDGNAHKIAGNKCLQITVNGKSKYRVYQAPQGIKPGEALHFRCWMKSNGLNGEATVILKFWIDRAKDQFKYFTPGWVKGTTDWREYSITVVAPDNFKGDLQIVCFVQNCRSGEAYFDDLRFERGEVRR